ncbi:uncharacterized protein [Prorops nasuta]|uniref:uncharacterized protein n=1 Tax=Prorops nasuta TaxID=863751 RepID=UPI0034CD9192
MTDSINPKEKSSSVVDIYLPIDVIIHIMSYLNVSDRMAAGLVNKVWREASLYKRFIDQQVLVIGRDGIDDTNQVLEMLQQSTRLFFHFIFKKVEVRGDTVLWQRFGSHMKSLMLMSCDLSEKTLVEILKCCKSLETLCISQCRECLMSGRLLDDGKDVIELSKKLQNVWELTLADNRYLSDVLFNRFVAICPKLISLNLTGCQVSFHSGLHKKFYPKNNDGSYASESIFTFINILHYISHCSDRLKHLDFGYTMMDGTALSSLSRTAGLKLESLRLRACDQLTINGFHVLTQHQNQLKVLDVSFCSRLTDASLLKICTLQNLEVLKMRRCRSVTDHGVQRIFSLQKLKALDISECEQLTGGSISRGILGEECFEAIDKLQQPERSEKIYEKLKKENSMDNLKALYARALRLDDSTIECISLRYKNLRVLDVGYSFNAVTDRTIQMIFKNLIFLRILKISHSGKITDAGLTGMRIGMSSNNSGGGNTESFSEDKTRFPTSACSYMEEEMANLHENAYEAPSEFKHSQGFSMLRLRGLQELDLSGCNKITDVSLKYAFAFKELRVLDLSKCQQITHVGLDHLTRNSPAIEKLNLSRCCNISDIGILYITQRLQRLRGLNLKGCSQLTSQVSNYVKQYCKHLQRIFDLCSCKKKSAEGLSECNNWYMGWTELEESNSLEIFIPFPPPLPNRR